MDKSKNKYRFPIPDKSKVSTVSEESPAHVGPFKGAIDIVAPLDTPVCAALDGEVHELDQSHDKWGPGIEFVNDVNYLTIKHKNGEFSQYLHLKKDSIKVKLGDKVKKGQIVALTGLSGWMTAPHLHFFVFRNFPDRSFKGLEIRFE